MNFKSIFKKRNYNYIFQLIKPFNSTVSNIATDISQINDLETLSTYFDVAHFEKIVVVASGPSSNKMKLENNALYICTNNSLQLVKKQSFIYIVHDPYYLIRYIKSFYIYPFWKGTIFWIINNNSKINNISYKKAFHYVIKKSRLKKEILITDFEYHANSKNLNILLQHYLESKFNFQYKSINSGFNCVLIGCVLSHFNKIPIEIFGFDMGVGGNMYFNKKATIGKSINGENNKMIVKDFFQKAYQSDINIINYSNFMNYEKGK